MKTTTNYDLFTLMEDNRDVDLQHKKTRNLAESMVEYGWIEAFPLMARKVGKKLIVIDGQHRLQIAREFGIPVKYVVVEQDIDVAFLNSTAKSWTPFDYANRFAKNGDDNYIELLDFHHRYGIPLTTSAAILANTSTFGNVSDKFYRGAYKIKSRKVATDLAECYSSLTAISKKLKKNQSIKALWACFHVEGFSPDRLVEGAERHGGAIRNMGTAEGFLELFEELYNFGRKHRTPLKFEAEEKMRDRRPVGLKRGSK